MKSELQSSLIPTGGQSDLPPPSDSTSVPTDDNDQAETPLTPSIVYLPSSGDLQVESGDFNGDEKELASVLSDNNKKADVPLTPPIVHLPTSGSLQVESDDAGDDATEPVYQLLEEKEESTALDVFLSSLGITQQHLNSAGISRTVLQQLYRQEFSRLSWLKWSSFDHLVEKTLQWPLLSPADISISDSKRCEYRIRPQERSLLLNTTWGLMKAYAVRGLVQGIELSLLESTHYFIYVMLAYRLVELLQTGHTQFDDFQDIFRGSSQKGIDSLVRSLAKIEAKWLKLILATPFLIGALQSVAAMYSARSISTETQQETLIKLKTRLSQKNDCQYSLMLEKIPVLNQRALGSEIQKLERWVRWDGRLDRNSRQQAFELIRRTAWSSKKVTQLKALDSLAKIAHGIGLKDFARLQRAGRPTEELVELLWIKTTAFADLELLAKRKSARHPQFNPQQRTMPISAIPRRLYAGYLLWWLGQATSWWVQRLPFTLLKTAKLGLEALFLQKIINSIIEAIHCPDKPGYQFGNGYQDWASDYTAECFTTRISLFRALDFNESVTNLVAEIPQYHLTEFTNLDLSYKHLTTEEATQIIQAVVKQKAPLQILDLYYNYLNELNESLFNGLNSLTYLNLGLNKFSVLNEGIFNGLSKLTYLGLRNNEIGALNEGVFSGLNQLTILDLVNVGISALNEGIFNDLSQLTYLGFSFNRISVVNAGVFSNLSQLTYLDLSFNQITILNEGVFSDLSQLNALYLDDNQISVLNASVFSGLSQLTTLSLSRNEISVLSDDVFSELSQLQILNVSFNFLNTNTIVNILSLLPILTELNIASNEISYLPQNFSILLPIGLHSLSIGGNSFIPQVLTREFMQHFPFQLTTFSLEFSLIVNITDGSFSDFSALTILDLTHNQLSVLSEGMFSGLSQLTNLDLAVNQIYVLNERVFSGLSRLTYLDLGWNPISILNEGAFSGLSQLTYLDLGGNQINALNVGVFSDLNQLTDLNLYNTEIRVLNAGVFNGLNQLTFLYLGVNPISVLNKGVFSNLSQLTSLYLSFNQISVLNEGIFNGLSRLTSLYLGYNQLNDTSIQNITQSFPYRLQTLDIQYNQIGDPGAQALAGLLPCTNLTTIYFEGNLVNGTNLDLTAQQNVLRKVCEDRRCHANLLANESCQINTYSADSFTEPDEIAWETADFFDEFVSDKTPSLPTLALPNITSSSQIATGSVIVGLAVSALLYRNSTWFHSIVNAGCQVLRRCWDNGKTVTFKTISLIHCRSILFSPSSTSTNQPNLPSVPAIDRASKNLV